MERMLLQLRRYICPIVAVWGQREGQPQKLHPHAMAVKPGIAFFNQKPLLDLAPVAFHPSRYTYSPFDVPDASSAVAMLTTSVIGATVTTLVLVSAAPPTLCYY